MEAFKYKTDLAQICHIQKVRASLVWSDIAHNQVQKEKEDTVDDEIDGDPLACKVRPVRGEKIE